MGELLEMPPLRPEHERVAELARAGAAEEDIAAQLQIPLKRLRKRYRRELETNRATAKNEMLASLYKTAQSGSNTTATMFWVKSQCGWRDTGSSAETIQIQPIIRITRRKQKPPSDTQTLP